MGELAHATRELVLGRKVWAGDLLENEVCNRTSRPMEVTKIGGHNSTPLMIGENRQLVTNEPVEFEK